jgi:hypothetical protein
MDRRRFLVIAGAASSLTLAGPVRAFAATSPVASVSVIRYPRQMMYGSAGACASLRPNRTVLTVERMLSLR